MWIKAISIVRMRRGYDMSNSIGNGHLRHSEGFFKGIRTVIQSRQEMTMDINHSWIENTVRTGSQQRRIDRAISRLIVFLNYSSRHLPVNSGCVWFAAGVCHSCSGPVFPAPSSGTPPTSAVSRTFLNLSGPPRKQDQPASLSLMGIFQSRIERADFLEELLVEAPQVAKADFFETLLRFASNNQ